MAEPKIYRGFFSYAHHDAETDPLLIKALTGGLERVVNSRLTNARFIIWRDKDGIRTGERWNAKIEAEIRSTDILIVLVTPKWIESDYCRKEYSTFEQTEASLLVGEYVAPILARRIDREEKYFTLEQREMWDRIAQRQYFKATATDFLRSGSSKRRLMIEHLADDIAGMIERLRDLPAIPGPLAPSCLPSLGRSRKEFNGLAESYAEVDFLRSSEVLVDIADGSQERGIYAQLDFVERLFVKTQKAYIEFGERRAYLSLDGAPGQLQKSNELRLKNLARVAYVTLHEVPEALSIVINAEPGRTLADLALPPTDGNYLSRIGTANSKVQRQHLRAELRVSFSPHGLLIDNERRPPLSPVLRRKIEAIIGVAIEKCERVRQDGQISRQLLVRERIA